ncbi:MAG: TetR/AcrR family transcriptional regulator [Pseudomonadota bacterium]
MNARGRPLSFDKAAVLTTAMDVFWQKGYAATSIQDLTDATGLSRASLYNAFGDKEHMFLAVVGHYTETESAKLIEALKDESRSGADAVRFYFDQLVAFSCEKGRRLGCLLTNTATHLDQRGGSLETILDGMFARLEGVLCATIQRGQRDGSINVSIDPARTAKSLIALAQGLRVLSRSSLRDEAFLRDAVEGALAVMD